jgi:hypothetical protein
MGLDGPEFEFRLGQAQKKKSSPTLGPAYVPIQWVLTLSMGNEAEAWCSPLIFF